MKFQSNRIDPRKFGRGQIKFCLILIPLAAFFILPLVYVFVTAFKPYDELFAFPPRFYVKRPTLQNFNRLSWMISSSTVPFARYLLNSLLSTAVIMISSVYLSLSAGYTLAKKKFRGKTLLKTINTLSLMFVPVAVAIPRFLVIRTLSVTNTFFALVLPLIAMPIGLFLMVQTIQDIPDALLDSARIDGASEYQILYRIITPMVKPAIATVAILAFQSGWNATEPSTFFITSDSMRTLPYFINLLISGSAAASPTGAAGMAAAGTLILLLPNLVIFLIMQSRVMNTMAHSGIK